MKYIIIFMYIHLNLSFSMCTDFNSSKKINEYISDQQLEIETGGSEINNITFIPEAPNIEINNIANISTKYEGFNDTFTKVFTLFNSTFLFTESNLFYIKKDNDSFKLKLHSKFPQRFENIAFIKNKQFNNLGIIVIGLKSGITNIYGFFDTTNEFTFIHAISSPNITDAHIFINRNNLYMIISGHNCDNFSYIRLYTWAGTHFDEIHHATTQGVNRISSFPSKNTEIIVLLQNLAHKKVYSIVYEFQYDRLRKIQQIETRKPKFVSTYVFKNETYVFIGEDSARVTLYKWNGYHLLPQFTNENESFNSELQLVTSDNSSTAIISFKQDKIEAHLLTPTGIELVNQTEYESNVSRIMDSSQIGNNETIIYLTVLDKENNIQIKVLSFKIHSIETENDHQANDPLQMCFLNLEQKIYDYRSELKDLMVNSDKILKGKPKFHSLSNTKASAVYDGRHFTEYFVQSEQTDPLILEAIDMNNRVNNLKELLDKYEFSQDKIVLNDKLILKKPIKAKKLLAKNVHIKKLNNQKWTPEEWLMYNQPQTITGPVTIKKIETENLETSSDDNLFKNILLSQGDQVLTGNVKIQNLNTKNLYTPSINDIEFQNLYFKSQSGTILGKKHFENVKTNEARIKQLNGREAGDILSLFSASKSDYILDPNVMIEDIWVDQIDGVNWNTFKDSAFRLGVTSVINGNLNFENIKTERLNIKSLNGIEVENFLTTSTDQIIHSDIEFHNIFTKNIEPNFVNGIHLGESAATFGTNTTIEGPVRIDKINVTKDLEFTGKMDLSLLLMQGEEIVGTNESHFLQTYNGKIKIKGDLFLKNVNVHPNAKMIISSTEFDPNSFDDYWTKSTNQEIPTLFEAENGMTSPHLLTRKLNGIEIGDYMLNNLEGKAFTNYHFENVTIIGNVILNNKKTHTPDLVKIDKEAVKTNGSFVISGFKTYENTLKVENLITNHLGGTNIFDVLTTEFPVNVTGRKFFKNLIVKGDLLTNLRDPKLINNINIKELKENTIYINQPQELEKLDFGTISVKNLYTTKINDNFINEYILKLEDIKSRDTINNLYVTGNVTMEEAQNVSKINDQDVNDLLINRFRTEEGALKGLVKFMGKVQVDDLVVKIINNIDFEELTSRVLYRNQDQVIVAPYTFTKIKTENLYTSFVNNISMEGLIDVYNQNPQDLFVPNGLTFRNAKFESLSGNLFSPCNLNEVAKNLVDPPTQSWAEINVLGNATFLDTSSALYNLFENAVTTQRSNIITAPVTFSKHISAENVNTLKHINDVNIGKIIEDALYKNSNQEQVVTGNKIFSRIHASNATVMNNADIPVVNDIDISAVNRSIIPKYLIHQAVVRGQKTFYSGMQAEKLYSKYVANMEPESMVNMKNLKKIPSVIFDYLQVEENLNISYINNIDMNYVLNERLLCNGPLLQETNATYFFNNIKILDKFEAAKINDIDVDDIVFDQGVQIIQGSKKFMSDVEIFGNAYIELLNGIKISETYENAILTNETALIDGSVKFLQPTTFEGNIFVEYINGYPVSKIKDILSTGAVKVEVDYIQRIIKRIEIIVKRSLKVIRTMSSDLMYIEKSKNLQILLPNTLDADAITTKGRVLIHITGEEPGPYCGLPDICKCPMQHTMEISQEHSINTFINKGSQRIYSYDDDNMIVNLITNSISTNDICRSNTTKVMNEVSSMSWNTIPSENVTGGFHVYPQYITGYISGVKFFTLNGYTYAVIGRYYDPVLNTHDLDCLVMKFSKDKTTAKEIQVIPAKGVWALHLFHAAQGVTLIVGNNVSQTFKEVNTEIYRFNPYTDKFELLRSIPQYGCQSASGVVLGSDSFIVLAYKNFPLQVLRYYPEYDNYYAYQSFRLDSEVLGISVFYTGDFGISDAHLCIVTANENYLIYTFRFIEGWKLETTGEIEGIRNLVPFNLNKQSYLFAPSTKISSLLSIVKHGYN